MTGEDKRRERYEEWRDMALRMADNMARAVENAAIPNDLQIVAQNLDSANGWRRQYALARQQMREYCDE
jgi:hypothetical protein